MVVELVKLGPDALPWMACGLILFGSYLLIRFLLTELLAVQRTLIGLLQQKAEAEQALAVENRRLIEIVQTRRPR